MKLLSYIFVVCYWWLVVCMSFRVKSVLVLFTTFWYNYLQGEMTLRGRWFDVLMLLTSVLAFKVCTIYWHVCLSGCWTWCGWIWQVACGGVLVENNNLFSCYVSWFWWFRRFSFSRHRYLWALVVRRVACTIVHPSDLTLDVYRGVSFFVCFVLPYPCVLLVDFSLSFGGWRRYMFLVGWCFWAVELFSIEFALLCVLRPGVSFLSGFAQLFSPWSIILRCAIVWRGIAILPRAVPLF